MKIIDKDTKHPVTKELMFNYEPTADSENGGGVHANELMTCIPLHFVVGKESNEVFSNDLKPFFDFANKIIHDGLKPRDENEKALKPFSDGTFPMDMSAEQKCFNLGGGCKIKEFFCIKCACTSNGCLSFLDKDSEYKCRHKFCVGDKCRHFEVDDQEEIDNKKNKLACLIEEGNHIEEAVADQTKIRFDPSVTNKCTDTMHIDYVQTDADSEGRSQFVALIRNEFKLREWSLFDKNQVFINTSDQVVKLKHSLMEGQMVKLLRQSIIRIEEAQDGFLFEMERGVPCILHMENRINEKIIVMTILEGLRHRTNGVMAKEYLLKVQDIFNSGMLAKENGNYVIPTERGELKKLSFSNVTARKLVNNIELVFDEVFKLHTVDDLERKTLFRTCLVDQFPSIMRRLRRRDNFSDAEIVALQTDIDEWYNLWISLEGREGMTNYVHLLGSGHIAYYLRKYRNLYRYSNQSWERLNKRVKRFYLAKTQRGGHGKYTKEGIEYRCPHTRPLARWLQRVIMWNTGKGEEYFIAKSKKQD